jgi:hypothetical protein
MQISYIGMNAIVEIVMGDMEKRLNPIVIIDAMEIRMKCAVV